MLPSGLHAGRAQTPGSLDRDLAHQRSGPRTMFSGKTPGLRQSDGGSASAGCWLGASSLAGQLGAVRSGAARVRHGAGCDSWSS
jgi:hypothetical protein